MITVILCSRNGHSYIRQQLDSILAQSIGELRVHIFDDASSDGTQEIVREYLAAFPDRVTATFRTQPSGSACRSFLLALQDAEDADYYMLSDQDDIWHPDKAAGLLTRIRELEQAGPVPALVFCDAKLANARGEVIAPSWADYQHLSPERTQLRQLLVMNQVTGGACLFNRALMDILRSVPVPEHAVMHDHFLALTAAAFGKIAFVAEPLYLYRQHEDNAVGARRAGMIRETAARLGLSGDVSREEADRRSRSVYEAVFDQAEEFRRLYDARLSDAQRQTVDRFLSIRRQGRIGKILTVLRYGYTFDTFYRTVGECLFI